MNELFNVTNCYNANAIREHKNIDNRSFLVVKLKTIAKYVDPISPLCDRYKVFNTSKNVTFYKF